MEKNNIAKLRMDKNLSQEALAEILHTTRQAISKWERGEAYPDVDRLKELASYFNVSIDYLLNYENDNKSVNDFTNLCLNAKK